MIFNASLVNLNTINTNAKSIDLIDLRKRLAIQVTSTQNFPR
ncbi:SMEK domain-containing protein [Klebsiella variicola subsp. variicola]|nr:SMEK domain-containing protein [Klebsiella variicola subsp. variicola]